MSTTNGNNQNMSTNMKKWRCAEFREIALERGLSINQALKLLVLKELGEVPPDNLSEDELELWLRGK